MRIASRIASIPIILAVAMFLAVPTSAEAYLGPGGVVSGVGALLALCAAIVASLFGFVWFPLKRLLRGRKEGRGAELTGPARTTSE